MAQKGTFEDIEVSSFESPFDKLFINYYGTEMPIIINGKTKFKGEKKKKIAKEEIQEGTNITKLSYELVGENYVALAIYTDISPDGSIKINGIFEGVKNGYAIIDGYPVELTSGIRPEGNNKKKCECKGFIAPNFNTPLIQEGAFYVEVKGKLGDDGVVNADKVTLCRNNFGNPERELLAAVNGNLTDQTKPLENIPADLHSVNMNLYNGEVTVGSYSYKLTDNIKLQGYVNKVGYKLLPKRAKKEQINQGPVYYRFYVIEDPIPNAFAFPNGMIFIHTGLLEIIENEAQLAVILGHEIAHVTHEHGRERYENTGLIVDVTSLAETFFEKSLSKTVSDLAPSLSPDMINSVNQITQAITPATISNIMKPQAKMESQADRVGLYYAYQAGYDIREGPKFWEKMMQLTNDQNWQSKVTSDLVSSLKSTRLSNGSSNIFNKLSSAGADALTKQILDTIYTSHPKAKKRARDMNKLVGSIYKDTNWDKTKIKKDKYMEILIGL